MRSKSRILWLVLAAVVVFTAGILWFYQNTKNKSTDNIVKNAQSAHYSGDFNSSVEAFASAVNLEEDQKKKDYIRLKLAFDLYMRNKNGDRDEAARIYKDLARKEEADPWVKANAIFQLVDLFSAANTRSEEYLRKTVFSDEPFSSVLAESNGDIRLATRKSYELADSYFPLSLIEFRIAGWYAGALRNGTQKTPEENTVLLAGLKDWTEKGEKILPATVPLYDKVVRGFIYRMNATDRRVMALYTDKNYEKAETSYKIALNMLAPEDKFFAYDEGVYTRHLYAVMLADVFGEKRSEDIRDLLKPLANIPPGINASRFSLYGFLRNETNEGHELHGHNEDIKKLREVSEDFRVFLAGLGLIY